MKPSISVLMPAHNSEQTIYFSIRSALRAMPKDAELLVFLDGCTDRTADVISRFDDQRIRVLVSESNIGVLQARQTLLEAARSDLVANLDSDDIAFPWRFRHQSKALKKHDADIVFGNALLFGPSVNKFMFRPEWPIALKPRQARISLAFTNPFVNSAMLAKRKSLVDLGGYKSKIEDLGMWLEAATVNLKIIRTAGYAVCYRVHPGQLSRNAEWQFQLANDSSLERLRNELLDTLKSTVPIQDGDDYKFELWKEYTLSSWGLMLQNIGVIDLIKYRLTHKFRDFNRNYRLTGKHRE